VKYAKCDVKGFKGWKVVEDAPAKTNKTKKATSLKKGLGHEIMLNMC